MDAVAKTGCYDQMLITPLIIINAYMISQQYIQKREMAHFPLFIGPQQHS